MSFSKYDLATAVLRSAPSPTRPRMKTETEVRLAPVDAKSAALYAMQEDLVDKIRATAADMESSVPVELEFEDSAVHHIEDLRQRVAAATAESDPAKSPR